MRVYISRVTRIVDPIAVQPDYLDILSGLSDSRQSRARVKEVELRFLARKVYTNTVKTGGGSED